MSANHPLRLGVQLPQAQRRIAYATFAAVGLSGVAWFVLHDMFPGDRSAVLHALLVTHGVAAAVALVVVGSLLPVHLRLAWRTRRNRTSGLGSLTIVGGLALTGLLLYYGSEEGRDVARWSHIVAGLAVLTALPLHVWLGRRTVLSRSGSPRKERVVDEPPTSPTPTAALVTDGPGRKPDLRPSRRPPTCRPAAAAGPDRSSSC